MQQNDIRSILYSLQDLRGVYSRDFPGGGNLFKGLERGMGKEGEEEKKGNLRKILILAVPNDKT